MGSNVSRSSVGLLIGLIVVDPSLADVRKAIVGAKSILPPRFQPMHFVIGSPRLPSFLPAAVGSPSVYGALPSSLHKPLDRTEPRLGADPFAHIADLTSKDDLRTTLAAQAAAAGRVVPAWHVPLVDRDLSSSEKNAALGDELIEAITRIEPIYDPTRVNGADAFSPMAISSGTARMTSVFGDRWERIDLDPNVDAKVPVIALAWQRSGDISCDDFAKRRPYRFAEPALTALTNDDCRSLLENAAHPSDASAPIVAASISVPVFAAPLPGSRMSSQDFWKRRRQTISDIQEKLRQKWQTRHEAVTATDVSP